MQRFRDIAHTPIAVDVGSLRHAADDRKARRRHLERGHVEDRQVAFLSIPSEARDPTTVIGRPTGRHVHVAMSEQLGSHRIPNQADPCSRRCRRLERERRKVVRVRAEELPDRAHGRACGPLVRKHEISRSPVDSRGDVLVGAGLVWLPGQSFNARLSVDRGGTA